MQEDEWSAGGGQAAGQAGRHAGGQAGWQGREPAARHAAVKNCAESRWKYYVQIQNQIK
jgi:hypothetical protein